MTKDIILIGTELARQAWAYIVAHAARLRFLGLTSVRGFALQSRIC